MRNYSSFGKRLVGLALAVLFVWVGIRPDPAAAQLIGPVPSPSQSIYQNAVYNLAALGDTVWIGPKLNRMIDRSGQWFVPQQADSVTDGRGRLYAINLAPDTVIAGIGNSIQIGGESTDAGMGFYTSIDGGENWRFIEQPLEAQDDTIYTYGGDSLRQVPVVVKGQSPPYDISHSGDVILSANWATGLLRSRDFGQRWERLLLPPSSVDSLVPTESYDFLFDPREDTNFLGFGSLIDSQGRVWLGSAGGVNISDNALTADRDQVRWQHITAERPRDQVGLLGDWVITIKEAPDGTVWLTNWVSLNGQQQGLVSIQDINKPYGQHLIGRHVNDVAFLGNSVIAAADEGLFVSDDNGQSWRRISTIRSPHNILPPTTEFVSADQSAGRLWVGTNNGLITTTNLSDWEIYRVNFPLQGGNQFSQDAKNVDHYAYPNPFSPRRHTWTRIKFEVKQPGNIRIRLFDAAMQPINTLIDDRYSPGTYEAPWDGLDAQQRQVANGPVFYLIETPNDTYKGKIMVLN
jgi:hypothetical protein